jgi:hypothetical protein
MNMTFQQIYNVICRATLDLPAIEVTFLIIILTICLLFKFTRTGLVVAYLFVYRWGWLFFMEQPQEMLVGYLIFGCIVGILTVVGMLLHKD